MQTNKDKFQRLEAVLKKYESTPAGLNTQSPEYLTAKIEYETMLNEKTKGTILRSKATLYEQNVKSSKFFLNLEKKTPLKITQSKL